MALAIAKTEAGVLDLVSCSKDQMTRFGNPDSDMVYQMMRLASDSESIADLTPESRGQRSILTPNTEGLEAKNC